MSGRDVAGLMPLCARGLTSLKLSSMAHLESLAPGSLARFERLRTLTITDNPQLRTIPQGLLTSARHQLKVNLSSNGLTWLDPASLPWPRVKELDLTSNPLHCDCHLIWLTEVTSTEVRGAECAGPGQLAGHALTADTPTHLMTCSVLGPGHISMLSVILVIISLGLGCISFAIYTFRRNLPRHRRLAIAEMSVSKSPWNTFSNDYFAHEPAELSSQQSCDRLDILQEAAPSRWTFMQPDCDCRGGSWSWSQDNSHVFTIR